MGGGEIGWGILVFLGGWDENENNFLLEHSRIPMNFQLKGGI